MEQIDRNGIAFVLLAILATCLIVLAVQVKGDTNPKPSCIPSGDHVTIVEDN